MNTLQADLDAAIPDAPLLPEVEGTLLAGRTALRRRRQGVAAGLVAAVTVAGVVAGTAFASGGTDETGRVPAVAQDTPTPPDPMQWIEPGTEAAFADLDGEVIMWDYASGTLLTRPGATVVRKWNPGGLSGTSKSVAMVIERAGATYWAYAAWDNAVTPDGDGNTSGPGGWSGSITPDMAHGLPFERWIHDEIAASSTGKRAPDLLTMAGDGTLTANNGGTILDQTNDVAGKVHPDNAVGAAALVQAGDAQLCAYAGQVPGHEVQFSYLPASVYGPDLPGCLTSIKAGWTVQ